MNNLQLLPIHNNWEYTRECCDVINEEWKGPITARTRMLQVSCDALPTSLILLENEKVIGHSKLIAVPNVSDGCFVELVVIKKALRGKGYGRQLMALTEDYCKNTLNFTMIYLATRGQEAFYSKLGYETCDPASIFGRWPLKGPANAKPNESTCPAKTFPPQEVFMKKSLVC